MPDSKINFGWSIFADDVRHEVTGKLIHIGVYGSNALVPSFPHKQRLVIISNLTGSAGDPSRTCIFRVYRDAEVVHEITLPSEAFDELKARRIPDPPDASKLPPGEQPERVFRLSCIADIPDLTIEEPGFIRVRWETDSGIVKAGSLEFLQAPKIFQPGQFNADMAPRG